MREPVTLLNDAVPGVTGPAPTSYEQFWPYYVSQHLHPTTRRIHVLGTLAGLGCVVLAAVLRRARLTLAAPLLGYGPAWFSHFRIERNKPASFGHPLWSARADLRLLRRYMDGTLGRDVSAVRDALGLANAHETLTDFPERSAAAPERTTFKATGRSYDHDRTVRHDRSLTATSEEEHRREGTGAASEGVSPTTGSDRSEGDPDLGSFLADGRCRVEKLAEGYFATDSFAKRGGYVELLVKELSNLTATRSELLRPLLRELEGGEPYLERFDEARRRQVDLLAQLDELTIGVGPRDVHQHQPERLIELVRTLQQAVQDYDRYEADDLLPFVVARLDAHRLQELGTKAIKASRRGPSHAHPRTPPADERSLLGKRVSALYDRLRNVAEHPERTIQTGGEEGP